MKANLQVDLTPALVRMHEAPGGLGWRTVPRLVKGKQPLSHSKTDPEILVSLDERVDVHCCSQEDGLDRSGMLEHLVGTSRDWTSQCVREFEATFLCNSKDVKGYVLKQSRRMRDSTISLFHWEFRASNVVHPDGVVSVHIRRVPPWRRGTPQRLHLSDLKLQNVSFRLTATVATLQTPTNFKRISFVSAALSHMTPNSV